MKELYDEILEIFVNNSNKVRSDSLIGSFKLDLGSVHEQPGKDGCEWLDRMSSDKKYNIQLKFGNKIYI